LTNRNPHQYEWNTLENDWPRSGVKKQGHWENHFGAPIWIPEKPIVASLEKKIQLDQFWEQRDKIDQLLKEDEEFNKWISKKSYSTKATGLHAFYEANFNAIKHTVYEWV
jgi:hypothetical protein